MKHIRVFYLAAFLFSFPAISQPWNSSGNNYTSGKLGVGFAAAPAARFHIKQSSGTDWSDGMRIEFLNHSWDFLSEANGERLIIARDQNINNGIAMQNGNFGISIVNPAARLHIQQDGASWNDGIRLEHSTHFWDILSEANGKRLIIARDQNNNHGIALENGKLGISKVDPVAKLHIQQDGGNWNDGIRLGLSTHFWDIVSDTNGERLIISRDQNISQGIAINNGKVGIGTSSPDHKLTVDGGIHAKEVKVDLSIPFPDYVFDNDYELPTLKEVKKYIARNKHLPEIPSAAEVKEKGLHLGDMNVRLLKKVEELTLYQIELLEKIEAYGMEIKRMQMEIQKLKE